MPAPSASSTSPGRSRLRWYVKLPLGLLVAAVLLLGAELIAHAVLGPPPPFDQVTRISFCRLEVGADRWRYSCGRDRLARDGALDSGGRPRVVFLGASSMFEPQGASVPEQVGRMLPEVDVISLAAPGLTVANLALVAGELEPLEPDLVVVYAGHNEYSQDVFHGRVQATRLVLLPVYGLMARSWLHAGLTRMPKGEQRRGHSGIVTTDPTALELAGAIEQRFAGDLELLIEQAPSPVLLSTLMRNPGYGPTGVITAPGSECAASVSELFAAPPRPALLGRARSLCGDSSITSWLEAHHHLEAGDAVAAREAFARSLQLDPLPLRAPLVADEVIRRVAERSGSRLVDLEAELGSFPDMAWFVDSIHFSPVGSERVAEVLAGEVRDAIQGE